MDSSQLRRCVPILFIVFLAPLYNEFDHVIRTDGVSACFDCCVGSEYSIMGSGKRTFHGRSDTEKSVTRVASKDLERHIALCSWTKTLG